MKKDNIHVIIAMLAGFVSMVTGVIMMFMRFFG